ncbi:conserved unknown protein [Ectocarpus siliculosus]|uniref:SET domain-containing protein n=1 Tax=Ectocarpus siliculosus TaxID=2880 RepID=D7FMG1_ECTSI|nr:conserved unknown protein [Ectocarpus siliculosus]|eukprot:CBJ29973.1 conserved unknown protein [Ectocarpus siliculosus]
MATPEPPPPRPPAAVSLPTARRKQRLYAWESLLPRFQFPPGFDEGGIIEKREVSNSGAVAGDAGGPAARAPFSTPPVFQARRVSAWAKHPSVRYEGSMPHRGGGRGFTAATDIAPGTLLLVEKRFLPMPTAIECGQAGGVGQEELCLRWILELPPARLKRVLGELRWLHPQSLQDLPESEAAALMSRHEETAKVMVAKLGRESSATEAEAEALGLDVPGIVRLFGALQSNGFASGIYLHPAMTNHSCRANAIKWRAGQSISDTQMPHSKKKGVNPNPAGEKGSLLSEIRATELIRMGQEITISYLEPREIALASRQARLKDQFGFDCSCVLCEGHAESRQSNSEAAAAAAVDESFAPLEAFLRQGLRQGRPEHQDEVAPPTCQKGVEVCRRNVSGEPGRSKTADGGEGGEGIGGDAFNPGRGGAEEGEGRKWLGLEDGGHSGGGSGEEEEEEDRGGLVARNVLERRLEAAESVVDLSRAKEVKWPGVLSEVLGYRRQASRWLSGRHISLARADKLIAKACIAILQGSTEAAQSDVECAEAVLQTSNDLPMSFGGRRGLESTLPPTKGGFKTRLLAVFVASLISRRKTQLLYLGDGPHPEAGACLADLSQAMTMLLGQGSEGETWIGRLPGHDSDGTNDAKCQGTDAARTTARR